jgi:hypothetical protein
MSPRSPPPYRDWPPDSHRASLQRRGEAASFGNPKWPSGRRNSNVPALPDKPWASSARHQRIRPLEPGKPRELAIRRTKRRPMFEGDRRKHCIHDQQAGGLVPAHEATPDAPVPLARLENAGGGLDEPGGDRRFGLGGGKRTLEYSRVCHDPQKGPELSQATRTSSGPESAPSSQARLFSWFSALG